MNAAEREALSALLRVNWAPTPEDVWHPLETHVDGLNEDVSRTVMAAYQEAARSDVHSSPVGVVVTGQNGSGKTHTLRWLREQVQRRGGYFFLAELSYSRDFWLNAVESLLSGLNQSRPDGTSQLMYFVRRLADRVGVSDAVLRSALSPDANGIDRFVSATRRFDRRLGECRNTTRALLLLASDDLDAQDVGEEFLTGGTVSGWDLGGTKPPQAAVREITRLLALTGASVFAVDQIDAIFDQTGAQGVPLWAERDNMAAQLGGALMEFRDTVKRMVTVVACLPRSWDLVGAKSVASAEDRFRQTARLTDIPSPEVGAAIVSAHFSPRLAGVAGFKKPYPTWPVLPEAFTTATDFTPRLLFKRIDAHIAACLATGEFTPLASLGEPSAIPVPPPTPRSADHAGLARYDERFERLRREVDLAEALTTGTENSTMPGILAAGLDAWIAEGEDRSDYQAHPTSGARPAVHAQLTRILNEETGAKTFWSFRAVAGPHGTGVCQRLTQARNIGGLGERGVERNVCVLRTGRWQIGPQTRQRIADFTADGGVIIDVEVDDLRTFAALRDMNGTGQDWYEWLRSRKPASRTSLLRTILGEPGPTAAPGPEPPPPPDPIGWPSDDPDLHALPDAIDVGSADGRPVTVELLALRKHVVVFAGSGSGKTVLLRRLVEECALRGVSSIVLDPNNDLARLGDAWPTKPEGWRTGDAGLADAYLRGTDVVVWTPNRSGGRPLTFQPLPRFSDVLGDPDELKLALEQAVSALAVRAHTDGTTAKAERGRAILKAALTRFAHGGGTTLAEFIDLLADLPGDAINLSKAPALAMDMAETLRAGMYNDDLFGGGGETVDPGLLLRPPPGKRARVSVISMVGLETDERRQGFVNQLQMALFAWVKRNPAVDRPLGGLFVMDEAQTLAPSGARTPCTESTLALAAQARKYGLGLVFATQAPKGIHNRIAGNAATQFYGYLNSPTQVEAAREIARAKGSTVLEIGRLGAGEFYLAAEGAGFRKLKTPLCLSHHPSSALTAEDVLRRARGGRTDT